MNTAKITFNLDIDGRKITSTKTAHTTGDAAIAAQELVQPVGQSAINEIRTIHLGPSFEDHHAEVSAHATVNGQTHQINLETDGDDLHEAVVALIEAAKRELWQWLSDIHLNRKRTQTENAR